MSAISTSKISPPIPCVGVQYGYSTPPPLTASSLGYSYFTDTIVTSAIPVNTPQSTAVVINQISSVPAGTYIVSCLSTGSATVPNVGILLQLLTVGTSTVLQSSNIAYFTSGVATLESQSNTLVFTSSVPFDVICGGTSNGGGSATLNYSSLQVVRIA